MKQNKADLSDLADMERAESSHVSVVWRARDEVIIISKTQQLVTGTQQTARRPCHPSYPRRRLRHSGK